LEAMEKHGDEQGCKSHSLPSFIKVIFVPTILFKKWPTAQGPLRAYGL